jgi:queuine/archaeosine tRNA-ribosyltransferase
VTPSEWRSYVLACQPDIVTALADTVLTAHPHSQKRLMKSIERSTAWLADILRPLRSEETITRPHILVCLAGGNEIRARKAFADGLIEPLYGKELELVSPSKTLDAGVAGYVFDLIPLRPGSTAKKNDNEDDSIVTLLKASLGPLPLAKPRIAHSCRSPHEILHLIQEVGVDLFDAHFAQQAADIGVALDFTFPVQRREDSFDDLAPGIHEHGKTDLGHNLFNISYAHDHSRLAASFFGAASSIEESSPRLPVCLCGACSPRSFPSWISHSKVDTAHIDPNAFQQPFTRAYIHHLLHTHEMSSHTLLVMHNLTVMDAFFTGVRDILRRRDGAVMFREEVVRFRSTYDENMVVLEEARREWAMVERARGKGRLHREKSSGYQEDI